MVFSSHTRYAFITWLVFHDRLATGVRMRAWGGNQPCVFCGERDESREHLFFACPYSFTVWSTITVNLLGSHLNPDWADTVASLLVHHFSRMDYVLLRLAFQVTIYYLWKERNSRRHNSTPVAATRLIKIIEKMIRCRIVSLGYAHPHRLEGLLRRWFEVREFQPPRLS